MTKYDFKKVATKSEIPPGRGKTVLVHSKPMALVNIDATFYAINSIGPP
ncbi:MAG: Rieske (2Fe-2S) protein [Terriglobia bacterium]